MTHQPGEDITLVASNPTFRIFTTLRHTQFNPIDLQSPTPINTTWKTADTKLLTFHSDRLQASARAFNWTDVANLFESEGDALLSHHLEQAVSSDATGSKVPVQGYYRALRAHIDVSRGASIDISLVAMGDDKPLSGLDTDSFHSLPLSTPPPTLALSHGTSPGSTPKEYSKVTIDTEPTPATLFTTHKTSHRTVYDAARARASIMPCSPLAAEVLLYNARSEIIEASVSTVYFYRGGGWVTPAAECGGNLSVTRRLALEGGFCIEGKVMVDDVADGEVVWLSNAARGFFLGRVSR